MSFKTDESDERLFWDGTEIFTEDGEVFDLLDSKFSDVYLSEIPTSIKVRLCNRVIGSSELTPRAPYAVFEKTSKGVLLAHLENPFFLPSDDYPEDDAVQYLTKKLAVSEKILNILKQDGKLVEKESSIYNEIAYLSYTIKIENQTISSAESFVSKIIDNVSFAELAPSLFLCHASEDKPFVDKLVAELDRYACYAWYDKREIFVGDSIVEKVNNGLEEADYLIVVFSPQSVNKPWVKRELNSSLMRQLSSKNIIILPVLKEKCEIPPLFKDIKYADFTISFEDGIRELIMAIRK